MNYREKSEKISKMDRLRARLNRLFIRLFRMVETKAKHRTYDAIETAIRVLTDRSALIPLERIHGYEYLKCQDTKRAVMLKSISRRGK